MSVHIRPLVLLLAAVISTACYQSPVPDVGPALPLDATLIGTWEPIDNEADPDRLTIKPLSDTNYYVEMPWDVIGGKAQLMKARAFLTSAGGATFVNLQDFDNEDQEYLLLKLIAHDERTLSVATLKKDLPRFGTREDLHAWLEQHANDTTIIQDILRVRKVTAR